MKNFKTPSVVKKPARIPVSVRMAPRLKKLLAVSAAAHGMDFAPWVERVLWASVEVQKMLIEGDLASDLPAPAPVPVPVPVPVRLYPVEETVLAHLMLLARATNYLERLTLVIDQCRRERWVLDELCLAEALHRVSHELMRLQPLRPVRKSSGRGHKAIEAIETAEGVSS
jgi:hypothetical protein